MPLRYEAHILQETKLVPELKHLDYGDRLSALNLPSLLYRRRRIDMITVLELFMRWRDYHLNPCLHFTTRQSLEVMGKSCLSYLLL